MAYQKQNEEEIARDLHQLLSERLQKYPDAVGTVDGGGCNWHCTIALGKRHCQISCFGLTGAEYLIEYFNDSESIPGGRTRNKEEVLSSVECWLEGTELNQVYNRFEFVDRKKRFLQKLESDLLKSHPRLREMTTKKLQHETCDLYYLWFFAGDRSSKISFWADNPIPETDFYWDECLMFRLPHQRFENLATVLDSWLCSQTMPSQLQENFPWIETQPEARYYEAGLGLEGEFIVSWQRMKVFFKDFKYPYIPAVLKLLNDLENRGYDKTLRAGHSMTTLILSRSRKHALQHPQPQIALDFDGGGMRVTAMIDDAEEILSLPYIKVTQQVDALLKRLEAKDIS